MKIGIYLFLLVNKVIIIIIIIIIKYSHFVFIIYNLNKFIRTSTTIERLGMSGYSSIVIIHYSDCGNLNNFF